MDNVNIPESSEHAGLQFGESQERIFMQALSEVFAGAGEIGRAEYASQQRRRQFGGRRDIMKVCGYSENPNYEEFWARYDRQDIAGRVIDLPVDQTWGGGDLEVEGWAEWSSLNRRLEVQSRLTELDRLASIGDFAVLLFGVRQDAEGVDTISEASVEQALLRPVTKLRSLDDIVYLQQYPRNAVEIDTTDNNPMSPRFGRPETYKITLQSQQTESRSGQSNATFTNLRVHWTRVLHVTPDRTLSDIKGRSRLLRILDRLADLDKVVGGSAEMFWQGADRSLIISRQSSGGSGGELRGSTETKQDLRQQAEEWAHGLRRMLLLTNGEVKTLPPNSPDPSGLVRVLVQLIAAGADIPYRILVGSEQGQLASTQDRSNFADKIANRRSNYAQPRILIPFIDRLAMWGVAPAIDALSYFWPPIEALSADERSTVDERKVRSMKAGEEAFALGGQVFDLNDYRMVLGFQGRNTAEGISGNNPNVEVDETNPQVQAQFDESRNAA